MCCIDFLAQHLSRSRRVRQGDSKALPLGLWDHCCLACYISCRILPAEHKHNQVDFQRHLQAQVRRENKRTWTVLLTGENFLLTNCSVLVLGSKSHEGPRCARPSCFYWWVCWENVILAGRLIYHALLTFFVRFLNCFSVCPTGCNANLFYADAPKPQLEVMKDAFWDYVAKATQTADDTLQMIKKSQIGQDIR